MVERPETYDTTEIGGAGYTPLTPGGHKCVLMQVQANASTYDGTRRLEIAFDTDQADSQPGFFQKRYLEDRSKWRGTHNIGIDSTTQYGVANLKKFCSAVAVSNDPQALAANGWAQREGKWEPSWGQGFCESFRHLKVGIVFRLKEYEKDNGQAGKTVKPYYFCRYDSAPMEQVPDPDLLENKAQSYMQQQGQWQGAQANAQGRWQPQGQPSTQMAYMQQQYRQAQPQQPQYQQQSFWQAPQAPQPQPYQQAPQAPPQQPYTQAQPQPYTQAQAQPYQQPPMAQAAGEGFMAVPDAVDDEGLPFS